MSFPGLLPIESPYQSGLVCPVFSISVNMAKQHQEYFHKGRLQCDEFGHPLWLLAL